MPAMSLLQKQLRRNSGFSLIELVVTSGLVVSFFGAAALVYRSISEQ
jgi:type II secretory pathway pseudopilin PulG